MVTKLQDIANQVAQEDISTNPRLRNEEIRRRMYGDWEEPVIQPEETPGGLQDATKQDTLAKTYAALRNNYNLITQGSSSDTSPSKTPQYNQTVTGQAPLSGTPNWLPSAVGYGLSALGQGAYAGLGAGATQLLQGNRTGAAGTLANIFTSNITEGKIPGIGSLAGTLASGIIGDRSAEEIGKGLLNSGVGTLVSMANPLAGIAYSLARNLGFNPAQGLASMFDTREVPESWKGGFFSSSYTPPSGSWMSSGNSNYSPYGGLSYSDTQSSSSSSPSSPSYSYSNPASSYGSW